MPRVTIHLPTPLVVEAQVGQKLSDLLRHEGHSPETPCGGKGRCGKCRVKAAGCLSAPTAEETNALSPELLAQGVRLACCTVLEGDAEVWPSADEAVGRIRLDGVMPEFEKAPLFARYGAAVDIGTTTLAAALYGENGLLARAAAPNPQRTFGADVITRVGAAMQGDAEALAACVRSAIAAMLRQMERDAGLAPDSIDCLVVTGNTAMLHFFTAEDPSPLSAAPFEAKRLFGEWLEASALGLGCAPGARVYLPRCMSAFVGADITTALLASGICDKPDTALLIDIGTNGEMALWHGGTLRCCSTAAGPAFEGAGLSCGMQGTSGAVDHVTVENGGVRLHVLGDTAPKGICGSGIVDALAAMKELEVMDETGCMDDDEFPLADGVCITQKDVRMVQLAKSAVCAGAKALLHHADLAANGVQCLAIAGGFGSYLDLHSAALIGLYPAELESRAVVLGNAALSGAAMILQSRPFAARTEALAQSAHTLDLSTDPVFMDEYVECMEF